MDKKQHLDRAHRFDFHLHLSNARRVTVNESIEKSKLNPNGVSDNSIIVYKRSADLHLLDFEPAGRRQFALYVASRIAWCEILFIM